jgi:thymidylate synthase ThyX
VRALRTVLGQRASPGADAEIRALAIELHRIMAAEVPGYFLDYVLSPRPTASATSPSRSTRRSSPP